MCRPTPILENHVSGCHGKNVFSHSPYQNISEDNFLSHSGGPTELFGIHEKLSWEWGCKVI